MSEILLSLTASDADSTCSIGYIVADMGRTGANLPDALKKTTRDGQPYAPKDCWLGELGP